MPLLAQQREEGEWNLEGPSVQEFNSFLQEAFANQDWWGVVDYGTIILNSFPDSPFAKEAPFAVGEGYFKLGEYELSNTAFSDYLANTSVPRYFEEAIRYKFEIAEQFAHGAKLHLFGSPKMPAWLPAKEEAIQIYNDVIAALPHAEITAQALLSKAKLQFEMEEYKPSTETLDLLIHRFPKHDLAAEAYLEKAEAYLAQCKAQKLDPDILDMADLNIRRFRLAFPREPRVALAEKAYEGMQEVFAESLYETACFFERFGRTKKTNAAQIYFQTLISKYPNTEAAKAAKEKLRPEVVVAS
jgi:outer membrane protein assembly factor BamD (BamD/ComL family)